MFRNLFFALFFSLLCISSYAQTLEKMNWFNEPAE